MYFGSGWVGRRTLSAEELARDVELLAADNNNLLTVQKLLGDSGGQATEEVALSVDNYLFRALLAMLQESSIRVSSSTAPKPLHPCVLQVGRVRAKVFRGRGCVPQARKCSYDKKVPSYATLLIPAEGGRRTSLMYKLAYRLQPGLRRAWKGGRRYLYMPVMQEGDPLRRNSDLLVVREPSEDWILSSSNIMVVIVRVRGP